ncbi:sensor histidine kinase [Roseovarius sp. S4756]|uniref:sensor histidine kinase n=1 Tax=Roseovarius maritimus TaxID=3342637 RepID=UPI00372C2479
MRLSLQFAFLYAVLSAAMFFGAYWMTDYEVRDWIEGQMRSDLVAFERVYALRGEAGLLDRIATLSEFSYDSERIYQLRSPHGAHLGGTVIDADAAEAGTHVFLPVSAVDAESPPSGEVSGYWTRADRIGPYTLIQGAGDHIIAEVLEALSIALVAGYILVISAGLIIGQFVGIRTERRIGSIMETLEEVAKGALSRRIPLLGTDRDDLSRVSGAINVMLDQLETLLQSQKQIATDIAHDLRTPLQRLRQRLERMQEAHEEDADLTAALGETETLIETFRALLRIAQIEAGTQQSHFVPVDLGALARDVVEIYQPVAEDEGQTLTALIPDGQAEMRGDPALLGQLMSNLIENAIRHSPPGAVLTLSLALGPAPVLIMSDDGPGIPAGERSKVFRRFYRLEKSRTTEGHGLGLPLVKAICTLHGAEIALEDNAPGLKVIVTFPGWKAA